MKLPKSVTALGLLMAVAAILVDPAHVPWLTTLLGAAATTKLAAVGALLSALGRALLAPAPTAPTTPEAP